MGVKLEGSRVGSGPKRGRKGAGLLTTANLAGVMGKDVVVVKLDLSDNLGVFGNNNFAGGFEKINSMVVNLSSERNGGKKNIFDKGFGGKFLDLTGSGGSFVGRKTKKDV